jgi:tRNA(Ile)-lysidine synthase
VDLGKDLARALQQAALDERIALAFSGGLDSSFLFDEALRHLGPARLVALHVDHGLQSASGDWAAWCLRLAGQSGVEARILKLQGQPAPADSIEAWARGARYEALAQTCRELGIRCLLTAHHRDDQAETILLRLARGSGLEGLAGIEPSLRMQGVRIVRPLLDWPRAALEEEARKRGLSWLEDPSNADQRFARNAIRHEVLPALRKIFPGADATLARAASHLREARSVLTELALQDLRGLRAPPDVTRRAQVLEIARCESVDAPLVMPAPPEVPPVPGASLPVAPLSLPSLLALGASSPARQRWALRAWLSEAGLGPPSSARLEELQGLIQGQVAGLRWVFQDHLVFALSQQLVLLEGASEIHRFFKELPVAQVPMIGPMDEPGLYEVAVDAKRWGAWEVSEHALAADQSDFLALGVSAVRLASPSLSTEPGTRTGLRLRLRAAGPSTTLKNLYQAQGIPGWIRPLFPAISEGGRAVFSALFGADQEGGAPTESAKDEPYSQRRIRWVPAAEPAAVRQLREQCLRHVAVK